MDDDRQFDFLIDTQDQERNRKTRRKIKKKKTHKEVEKVLESKKKDLVFQPILNFCAGFMCFVLVIVIYIIFSSLNFTIYFTYTLKKSWLICEAILFCFSFKLCRVYCVPVQ